MCGASNVTLFGSEVRSDLDDNVCDIGIVQAERFTLTGIGADYPIEIADPLQLSDRSTAKGPYTFEVFAAYLTRIGIDLPHNAVIINNGRVVDKEDIVEANPGTDVAHLTLFQYGDYVDIPPYLEKRPSALHPIPDAPCATVFTLRKEFVHSTMHKRASRRQEVLLCETCYMVVNLKPVPVLRSTAISNP